ncbi:MAG: ATP-dependent DNA helicase RecG [Patescibacteria group bacterium]
MIFADLKRLGIESSLDLLNHIPIRYVDYSNLTTIANAVVDEVVTIKGKIASLRNIFTKRGLRMQIGALEDNAGKISIVWFNQPFLTKALFPGREVALSGKVTLFSGRPALVSPEYETLTNLHDTTHTGRLIPVYPETSGISSKWIRTRIRKIFAAESSKLEESLPKEYLKKTRLATTLTAYQFVHFPKNLKEAETGRKRLAFNELLNIQLNSMKKKLNWQKKRSANKLTINSLAINKFINQLPFKLTASQKTATDEILNDLQKNTPMNRLLEGDVGSGKTVVAAIAAYAIYLNGKQSVFMAPTQILAQQHFDTLKKFFPKLKISLVISNGQRPIANSYIYVGTHALLHSKLDFKNVALVVIDEQHRFGVEQRATLIKKSKAPHVLTMTATPIPRTIAQTLYGDLDLSTLSEMPAGRQNITTWHVPPSKRDGAYEWIKSQITNYQSQVFVVCPLIDQSDKETMKDIRNVTTEYQMLKKQMSNLKLGLLHGRLKSKEKDKVLKDFRNGKTDILVTTPVVEVGIDIPNATIMVIEAAERFGLAQLHQLRGRVGRSDKKSYCLLFSNVKYSRRLNAMTKTNSGFILAELDLKLRGPGEIFGIKQHGFPQFKAASWSDTDLIKKTKILAEDVFKNPKSYKNLIDKITTMS